MVKSVHTSEYATFLKVLRAAREKSGVTQIELAKALGISQSHLSKMERGELRVVSKQSKVAPSYAGVIAMAARLPRSVL